MWPHPIQVIRAEQRAPVTTQFSVHNRSTAPFHNKYCDAMSRAGGHIHKSCVLLLCVAPPLDCGRAERIRAETSAVLVFLRLLDDSEKHSHTHRHTHTYTLCTNCTCTRVYCLGILVIVETSDCHQSIVASNRIVSHELNRRKTH